MQPLICKLTRLHGWVVWKLGNTYSRKAHLTCSTPALARMVMVTNRGLCVFRTLATALFYLLQIPSPLHSKPVKTQNAIPTLLWQFRTR